MKANDIKKGNVVEYNNGVYQIRDIERSSPQGRGGNVRFRFIMYSVPGGNKLDASFDADDNRSRSNCCAASPPIRTRTAMPSCSSMTRTTPPTPWTRT